MIKQQIINLMAEVKQEQKNDIKQLKEDVKTGNADEENYDSLRMVISERYAAKMEVLETVGKLL